MVKGVNPENLGLQKTKYSVHTSISVKILDIVKNLRNYQHLKVRIKINVKFRLKIETKMKV